MCYSKAGKGPHGPGKNLTANLKELVLPFLNKCLNTRLNTHQKTLIHISIANIQEVTDAFGFNLSSGVLNLSPAEIQIANLVKAGKSSKEIASLLNISPKTVKNHRHKIRDKVGIKNKKINLRTYLAAFGKKAY